MRNAIRHAPEGTAVEIDLELHGEPATIVVRDHGPGVPDELLGAIFEPFFRVEGHRSRASGGVGLGLAIARRAVDLHRGRISAHNARPGLVVTSNCRERKPEAITAGRKSGSSDSGRRRNRRLQSRCTCADPIS